MTKPRLLLLTPSPTDATSFYRGIGPFSALRLLHDVDVTPCPMEVSWATYAMYTHVVMQRPFHASHVAMARLAKQMGLKLWLDYDDALDAVPPSNNTFHIYSTPAVQSNLKALYAMADVVTTTTEALAVRIAVASPKGKSIVVIPNAWDDVRFGTTAASLPRRRLIAWRGGQTHAADLAAFAGPVAALNDKYREWHWLFMGAQPWPLIERMRPGSYTCSPSLDLPDYFRSLGGMSQALHVVPLAANAFNEAKSNIAYIEAAAAGAACVVPAWQAWRPAHADMSLPGSASYEGEKGFYEAVSYMLERETELPGRAKAAWGHVQKHLMLSEVNKKRLDVLGSIT